MKTTNRHMPQWLESAVFYEIYPQSFRDSNGDGIGDLKGIMEKMDHIQDLGCTALWLNPCFLSPFADAGYDIQDYFQVAPRYGTNQDLMDLFQAAHARGIRVILDLVPGHTSWQHPWFLESSKPEPNEYTDRYVWTDSIWEAPQGMQCLRGLTQRDGSVAVNFFSTQPALNYGFWQPDPACPWQQFMDAPGPMATRQALKAVLRFWLDAGCDGFRVDMAGSLVKNDPESLGTIALWQDIRAFLDTEYPQAALVSEWGEPDKSLQAGFHMDFLLHFGPSCYTDLFRTKEPWFSRRGKGSLQGFLAKYRENHTRTGGQGLICIPSGNHDMDRMARHLSPGEMKLAFAFLLSMPGAPFIYYGDEIGLRQVEGVKSVEGGYGRTGGRSPMQWDGTLNAGFSAAAPERLYIPQDPSPDRPTVQAQDQDPQSLLQEVRKLIALRKSHPALQSSGDIRFLSAEGYPLVYERSQAGERIIVVLNPAATAVSVDAALFSGIACLSDCLIHKIGGDLRHDRHHLHIPGDTAAFYQAPAKG